MKDNIILLIVICMIMLCVIILFYSIYDANKNMEQINFNCKQICEKHNVTYMHYNIIDNLCDCFNEKTQQKEKYGIS